MRSPRKLLVLAALITTISIAFPAHAQFSGRSFPRPEFDALVLGKTTEQQIKEMIGEPLDIGRSPHPVTPLIRYDYTYASGLGMLVGGTPSGRWASFIFSNGVLVGYKYVSSFSEDKTDFDDSKSEKIIKGQSTRSDVEGLLGKPNGVGISPWVPGENTKAYMYEAFGAEGNATNIRHVRKTVTVFFDANDVVTDVRSRRENAPSR